MYVVSILMVCLVNLGLYDLFITILRIQAVHNDLSHHKSQYDLFITILRI